MPAPHRSLPRVYALLAKGANFHCYTRGAADLPTEDQSRELGLAEIDTEIVCRK
jgi:hypothetical protein